MGKISGAVIATSRIYMLLPIAVAGCAQVFGIESWSEQSTGGAGGMASSSSASGTTSSSSSTGGQGGQSTTASSSVGPGGQGPASSSSAGTGGQGGQGGQGAASSSSAGTGGQGGTGGIVGTDEICDSGADEDLDGHIDCADPECTLVGYRCAKQLPSPWQGPVILHVSDPNTPLPACGEGWANPTDYLAGTLMTDPVQCGSCSCGSPMGGQCGIPAGVGANVYGNGSCGSPPLAFTAVTQPNTCTLINNPTMLGSFYSASLAGQAMVLGGCAVMAGIPTIPPASFSQHARICQRATMAKGCSTGFACAAPVPPAFKNSVCIYQMLDDNTPPAFCPMPYGQETMLYKNIADQRSCTACECKGSTCATTISLFSGQACGSANLLLNLNPGDCGLLQNDGQPLTASIDVGAPSGSTCTPTVPVPQGTVTGTGRTQVCCTP